MSWLPNKTNGIPVYKQISNYMESRIMNGEYPSGSTLPSERHLAAELHVNRSTIVSSYDELYAIGLVKRVKGIGTVVSIDNKAGGTFKRIPNWEEYVKSGVFQSNNPLNQQIYKIIQSGDQHINFAIGELSPDLLPIRLMQEVHNSMEISEFLGYEHMQGNMKLREAITSHLKTYRNVETNASSILITSGAQQALHLIIQCLLKPGDSVAIEDPSYAYSLPIFQSAGLKTFLLPIEEEGIDPEQIVSLYKKHRIKMVFLNPIFQNPTGNTMSYERRKKVLEISTQYGIAVVEDDPYSVTGYDNEPIRSLKSMDQDGSVLYISSLSKIISSGLRIGWIVGPQAVIQRLTDAKQQIDFGHPNYPQWIAAQLLSSEGFETHIQHLRIGLKRKRDITLHALQSAFKDNIEYGIPSGGIHLWCKLKEELNEQHLFKECVKNGIVFAPGSTLGSNDRYMRFTYSRVDDHMIEEGIRRFAEVIKPIE
ncbi:MocR-like pyridoxine biosynthesis transcription factor PdxR [Paenibacillus sp. Root444D2]|uniref:MocR-like pyridoxine biosynthesis transcription factor PdxR n=1 Tax=Paenibacillus sp. Root444D2 TaxID=1736538 RepID=UPI000710358B|nr:PLP-dependent aminotransferase family protein [Paenibacillus sp. Root444D2]KQX48821.1 GntR family transcriptional regulator [Paenibacillus sp. Root444D2]